LVIMGLKTMGKTFALKTTIAVMGLAFILAWVEFPRCYARQITGGCVWRVLSWCRNRPCSKGRMCD
jgi:hypothetical protein